MERQYCIYRYIDKNTSEILYVGKTDTILDRRIIQHKSEDKFRNINADIEYIELNNSMETRFLEFYFINKWKPALNVSDKYSEELSFELNNDVEWKKYVPEPKERKQKSKLLIEEKKQKYIEEGIFFDGTHIPMNIFNDSEKELFIFLVIDLLK